MILADPHHNTPDHSGDNHQHGRAKAENRSTHFSSPPKFPTRKAYSEMPLWQVAEGKWHARTACRFFTNRSMPGNGGTCVFVRHVDRVRQFQDDRWAKG